MLLQSQKGKIFSFILCVFIVEGFSGTKIIFFSFFFMCVCVGGVNKRMKKKKKKKRKGRRRRRVKLP